MSRTITANMIAEKNKQESSNPFIKLVELNFASGQWLYLTNHPVASIYNYYKTYHDDYTGDRSEILYPHDTGSSYEYLPFVISNHKENNTGQVEGLSISVDNSTRVMESYLHTYELQGREVIIKIVNANLMTDATSVIQDNFIINEIVSGGVVTFKLGHMSVFSGQVSKVMGVNCNWTFKDTYCGYAGAETTCKKILGAVGTANTCRDYLNSARYGGFPNAKRTAL